MPDSNFIQQPLNQNYTVLSTPNGTHTNASLFSPPLPCLSLPYPTLNLWPLPINDRTDNWKHPATHLYAIRAKIFQQFTSSTQILNISFTIQNELPNINLTSGLHEEALALTLAVLWRQLCWKQQRQPIFLLMDHEPVPPSGLWICYFQWQQPL